MLLLPSYIAHQEFRTPTRLMRMAPPEENADPAADPWAEFIRVTAPEFRKPTIEQQATVTKPIWETLVAGRGTPTSG